MANVVHKLTATEIQSLMSKIKFDTSQLPQGMKARAKHNNAVINIYNSGKVMFQGKNAEIVAQQLLPEKVAQHQNQQLQLLKKQLLQLNIINITVLEAMKLVVAIILVHSQYVRHMSQRITSRF